MGGEDRVLYGFGCVGVEVMDGRCEREYSRLLITIRRIFGFENMEEKNDPMGLHVYIYLRNGVRACWYFH